MDSLIKEIKTQRIDLIGDSDINDVIKLEFEEDLNELLYKCDTCKFSSVNFNDYQAHACFSKEADTKSEYDAESSQQLSSCYKDTCKFSSVNFNDYQAHACFSKEHDTKSEYNAESSQHLSSSSHGNTVKTILPFSNEELIYKCDRCDFTSENFGDYQGHDMTCFCDVEDPEPAKKKKRPDDKLCEFCNEMFCAVYLKKHIKTMHTNPKPLDCKICGKVFQTSLQLTKHMNLHCEFNMHICNICKDRFARATGLRNHMKKHKQKRQYTCDVCWMKFSRPEALEKHSDVHMDKFECDVCHTEFTKKYYLTTHKRLHTGEGLLECTICNLFFPLKCLLTKHRSTQSHIKKAALKYLQSLE